MMSNNALTISPAIRIETDPHNFILVRRVPGTKLDGTPIITERRSYHRTLAQALEACLHDEIRNEIAGGLPLEEIAASMRDNVKLLTQAVAARDAHLTGEEEGTA